MKVLIYLFEGFTALDVIGPYESLSRIPEIDVQLVAEKQGVVRTGDGFVGIMTDAAIGDVSDCDLLILPGGNSDGLRKAIGDTELHEWIRLVDSSSRWTASVCTGALILAASGLASGHKLSTHWNGKDYLGRFGVEYSSDRITFDGKYISCAGVSAGIDMGLRVCEMVAGREVAEAVELSMEYAPEPPFGTGDFANAPEERVRLVRETLRI